MMLAGDRKSHPASSGVPRIIGGLFQISTSMGTAAMARIWLPGGYYSHLPPLPPSKESTNARAAGGLCPAEVGSGAGIEKEFLAPISAWQSPSMLMPRWGGIRPMANFAHLLFRFERAGLAEKFPASG
jgi:hypothetical protein